MTLIGDGLPVAGKPMVIGHRGASALRPEHTLASYQQAIDDGADVIEPDLVITRDGVLVARHEPMIAVLDFDGSLKEATTNVAELPPFADRKTTKVVDGQSVTGWFAEDFTLAELKTLRARERLPMLRPANTGYDDRFEIPTLDEIIQLAADHYRKTRRVVGLYPETKHPTYFRAMGLPLEERLIATLHAHAYTAGMAPIYIQSFEVSSLQRIRTLLQTQAIACAKTVQLMGYKDSFGHDAKPYDWVVADRAGSYSDMASAAGLAEVACYADAIGPHKEWLIPSAEGKLGEPTPLIAAAHRAGLIVHGWTFRPENSFLPAQMRNGSSPTARNPAGSIEEIKAYLDQGLDGFFTDDPAVGRAAVDLFLKR